MKQSLPEIFKEVYRELRPRAPLPEIKAEYYQFANINNTIRLREGILHARISDLLEGAPESVLHAIAHILLVEANAHRRHDAELAESAAEV